MSHKLIVLRGNSGCGKTTTAKILQQRIGHHDTMLVSQDVVRREMLHVRDVDRNASIELIYRICMYGSEIGHNVILEGILSNERYGKMLTKLLQNFAGQHYVYYFDVPFEETLARHITKSNAHEFGEKEMREWWKAKDYLGVKGEAIIDETYAQPDIVKKIISDISK